MLNLSEDILLYHGSYTAVPEIDLSKCNSGLDFGRGFYVTTSYDQAVSFVPNSVKRNIRTGNLPADFDVNNGQVSVYRFHPDPMLLIEAFSEANLDWLHFVAANRNRNLFKDLYDKLETHDIIGGKIADDNTSRVLNGYVTGLFGTPGSDLTDMFAIQSLLPNRLKDQFCFRTEASVKSLEFVRSDRYGDITK